MLWKWPLYGVSECMGSNGISSRVMVSVFYSCSLLLPHRQTLGSTNLLHYDCRSGLRLSCPIWLRFTFSVLIIAGLPFRMVVTESFLFVHNKFILFSFFFRSFFTVCSYSQFHSKLHWYKSKSGIPCCTVRNVDLIPDTEIACKFEETHLVQEMGLICFAVQNIVNLEITVSSLQPLK